MRTYSYENILRAVGQVLDDAHARDFVVREEDDGLSLEVTDGHGERLSFDFTLGDLVKLTELKASKGDEPHYERSYAHDEDTLRHFLMRRDAVGVAS